MSDTPKPEQKAVKHPPKPPRNPFTQQKVDRSRPKNENHARDVRHK